MKFTLYWLDGKREVVEGPTIAQAMTSAGYGNGALPALDFYSEGDNKDYSWDKKSRSWVKNGQ